MFCSNCGKEIPDDSEFCAFCGAAQVAAAPAAVESAGPPPAAEPPSPPPGGAMPPAGTGGPPTQYGPPAAKKSPLPWILGIVGLLVVAAVVVLLLGFAVGPKWFAGDDDGGDGKPAENPEATVEAFFGSLVEQDAKMLIETMEPDFVDELKDALGDDYVDLMQEYFFAYFPEDLEIDIKKMDSEIMGDEAEVTIEEGTISYTDEYGDKFDEDVSSADMDAFELVKVDGKWYLSEDTLVEMGFGFSDLEGYEDLDFEDMDFEDGTSEGDMEGLVELPVDSEDEVLTILFEDEEIWDWYTETDWPSYDITEEGDRWVVYLYEYDENDNEVAYGFFEVDKETGELFMITNE
jgi:hypothetical protein